MAIFGDGQKEYYSPNNVWKVSFLPEEMQIMLWEASNIGKMGSKERIEAVTEAMNLARYRFPYLFRPKADFYRFPQRAGEMFENNHYVGMKNL